MRWRIVGAVWGCQRAQELVKGAGAVRNWFVLHKAECIYRVCSAVSIEVCPGQHFSLPAILSLFAAEQREGEESTET
jgi:hypothetical protein